MDLSRFFQKQKIMSRVLVSLFPILLFAIYLFGWRVLLLLIVVCLTGILCEYAAMRLINGKTAKVSEAVLVSCLLFTLTLPPATPWWVAALGIAFGIFFGKGVFGGFGRNIFNPALVGRCLIYVSFPAYLTRNWTEPFTMLPGGLAHFGAGVDAVATATPMLLLKNTGTPTDYWRLFLGTIAGSAGETSALLILLAAGYLIATRTASWKIMLSSVVTFTVLDLILFLTGATRADPLFALLSGGFLFAAVFMATDPVSAPANDTAKWIYGFLIAAATLFIRTFALFTEGAMFAILVANTFAPLLDRQIKALTAGKKAAA
jgi:Na+-transporting NADH:ubiquinone oxidoreductase subunit B